MIRILNNFPLWSEAGIIMTAVASSVVVKIKLIVRQETVPRGPKHICQCCVRNVLWNDHRGLEAPLLFLLAMLSALSRKVAESKVFFCRLPPAAFLSGSRGTVPVVLSAIHSEVKSRMPLALLLASSPDSVLAARHGRPVGDNTWSRLQF